MDQNERTFERTGTTLVSDGEGRITIHFRELDDSLEAITEQTNWLMDMINQLVPGEGKIQVLADLEKLETASIDDAIRLKFRSFIEDDRVDKVAVVGNALLLAKTLTVLILLKKNRNRIKFFFNFRDA